MPQGSGAGGAVHDVDVNCNCREMFFKSPTTQLLFEFPL